MSSNATTESSRRWHQRWWATAAVVALACAAMLPAVDVGFAPDDHIQRVRSRAGEDFPGFGYDPLDLFVFASGDPEQRAAGMDVGVFSWWTADDARLAFWRPLTSATHAVEHRLYPERHDLMVLQNIAWLGLLVLAVGALYRRFATPGVAFAAFVLYALDDAHAPAVAFISNRNAAVSVFFGVVAVVLYDRWRRDQWAPGRWAAPLTLAVALLAGEGAVAAVGYLGAHALVFERGPLLQRLRPLTASLFVFATWLTLHRALGYGASGSGVYLDPGGEPVAFVAALARRLPVLLLGQYGTPPSDFWFLYPPAVARGVWITAVAALGAIAWLTVPLARRHAALRFLLIGTVLAAVPIAATFPSDRLLMFVGVGASAHIAWLLGAAVSGTRAELGTARLVGLRAVAIGLLLIHGLLGPLSMPIRARSMETIGRATALFDEVVPVDPGVGDRTVVVVTLPSDGLAAFHPLIRASQRQPRPAHLRILASGAASVEVTRVDQRTLVLRPELGFLAATPEQMMRGPSRPFSTGDRVRITEVTVVVDEITADGRPAVATFVFDAPLDDPRYLWTTWEGAGFASFTVPPIGDSVVIPPLDGATFVERLIAPPPP